MKEMRVSAPAKINIGLHIVNKRDDGFHNIESIFYPVKLCDELIINPSDTLNIHTDHKELKDDKSNTVLRAVKELEKYTGTGIKVDIELIKNIPIGAGMGGGSTDGAAALKALNELYLFNLSNEVLESLALNIGSDVPFFIDPIVKVALSRGEKFRELKCSVNLPLLIVNPGIHVSTAWAYSKIVPFKRVVSYTMFKELNNDVLKENKFIITNDFEDSVFTAYPEIGMIKQKFYDFKAVFALMTGSGSTVFGFFENIADAKKAEEHFKEKYFTFLQKE